MPSVMVLGPSKWIEDDPRYVSNIRASMTPLELRQRVAEKVRVVAPAIIMEDEPPATTDVWLKKFLGLIEEHDVRTFLIIAPLGARHNGLDIEVGHLLTRLFDPDHGKRLHHDDVAILAESKLLDIGLVLGWSEPGNRTNYYNDLIAAGCILMRWDSLDALFANALAVAVDHATRHPADGRTPPGPAEVVALFEHEEH